MFDLYYCITGDHDIRLVALAALVCLVSTASAVLLLRQARLSGLRGRAHWTIVAGVTTGLGIWTTHFVAMLGYDPGIVVGYDLARTVVSLVIAMALTTAGFFAAVQRRSRFRRAAAAVMVGGGIATMHYVGMSAVEFPGTFSWRTGYVALSLLFAVLPIYPALALTLDGGRFWRGAAAAGLMTLAIVLLHFTAMTALQVVPIPGDDVPGMLLSSGTMSVSLAAGAIGILLLTCAAVLVTRRTQAALRVQLDLALSNMHQGLCLFDRNERLILRNQRFLDLWNLAADDCAPGLTLRDVAFIAMRGRGATPRGDDWYARMHGMLSGSLASPDSGPVIAEIGEQLVLSIASRALPDGGWVSTFDDITERRRSEEKIAFLAMHDSLTGLPNRARFNLWLDFELERAERGGQRLAVIVMDLDGFKEINDTHGHAAGDALLAALAARLGTALGEGEVIARLGGDEFAAAKTFTSDAELEAFVTRLESCFADPFASRDSSFLVGASIGVAAWPADGGDRETILNNADLAMYRAKASIGKAATCYYQPGMDEAARGRRQLANDLRQAIDRDEFSLAYQPQHSLRDGALSGYEALLRWNHSARGWISPTEFIPVAEETGEIFRIGQWVLREACAEARRWPGDTKIAVNLSPVQLMQPDLAERVTEILLETGLSPSRLELEITESAIIGDKVRALQVLRRIKALGISIAMDDFGTGYSSLDTLHSFPFDKIKIDKSFVLGSGESPQARAIIRAVLALGQSLNVPVLAEGVESAAQLQMLESEGCDEVQGFYLGAPAGAPSKAIPQAA
ncbi:EAL domain-containing protein [Sphingomonas sp.]|uniref:EAL domain-containing protein n=1 Tax=Sphingomonas sp. TaxID=28214 RepID=UPI002EDA1432